MLSVAVQAGGQSLRMGENKALKLFLGRPLVQRVVERLMPIADDLLITTNEPGTYDFLSIRQVADLRPGSGPLGGLFTALSAARMDLVAVVACDLPFASAPLLVASAGILQQDGVDVVIAETPEGYEPLHAVYRRSACLPAIAASLDAGKMRVISWFPHVKVRKLADAELVKYDPDRLAFWNVNTPEEFVQAEAKAAAQQP